MYIKNLYRVSSSTNKMGGACSSDGEERCVYRFFLGNLRDRDNWGDPGVGGRITLR
jgi:hypothetical protein